MFVPSLDSTVRALKRTLRVIAIAIILALAFGSAQPALAATSEVETTWKLLDYIAVDYRGAVSNGKVKSAGEFADRLL